MQKVSNSSEYQRWAERARQRGQEPVDFNQFKPLIRRWRPSEHDTTKWICTGAGPNGQHIGFGPTPGEAYEAWTKHDPTDIPF